MTDVMDGVMSVYVEPGARVPVRAHACDAGIDLCARIKPDSNGLPVTVTMNPHSVATFGTGVHVAIGVGCFGEVMSRSGLNRDHGITATGVIDSGYTGEICVTLHNDGDRQFDVHDGDRIAQLVIMPCLLPSVAIVSDNVFFGVDRPRGSAGFGSTGI